MDAAKIGGKSASPHHLYGPVESDLKVVGKKSLEWDLNDWKWDGDLFTATPLNSTPSDCMSRHLFPVAPESSLNAHPPDCLGNDRPNKEPDKRRRMSPVVVENHDFDINHEAGLLNLKLGGLVYPVIDEDVKSGKKTRIAPAASNHVLCQVQDCRADLSNAKDYHRRHKVCDIHSKASTALVGNVLQRFCQQCSRFHALQEFDEGKRSCRRRLAGHNKRRRKTHSENVVNDGSLNDEKGSNYLLISLLRILANLHANSSDQIKDQDLLSHLLRNLSTLVGSASGRNLCGLPQSSQGLLSVGTTVENPSEEPTMVADITKDAGASGSRSVKDDCAYLKRSLGECGTTASHDLAVSIDEQGKNLHTLKGLEPSTLKLLTSHPLIKASEPEFAGKIMLNSFDLNDVHDDSQDYSENLGMTSTMLNPRLCSVNSPLWVQADSQKTSTPHVSGNSNSTSTHSPLSSSGMTQSCTDRIVFKLFGKDPNDFPVALRMQILNWMSHSPTEIESYIRPGCIILTVYLCLGMSEWEQICHDLGSSLTRLIDTSNDSFWRSGWVYARVHHSVSFIYNGRVVLDAPLPLGSQTTCRISSIRPIAVPLSDTTRFIVKGFNIVSPTTRLLCALEGKYLVQETSYGLMDNEHNKHQCLSFTCSLPNFSGRGFIEVEDNGLSGSFFPFIVAEKEVCSEIRLLEDTIDAAEIADNNDENEIAERTHAKIEALDFIHEMGWLLHRRRVKFRLRSMDPTLKPFPFKRFQWLMEFSVDRDWCAVLKKLLAIFFDGSVDLGDHPTNELALLDMAMLHRAVQRNSRAVVEMLLRYVPDKNPDMAKLEQNRLVSEGHNGYIFKPDVVGPAGLTPLHIAASLGGCEEVLDALTDDPGMVGIEAWRRARDTSGFTPYDYACLRGHCSYIHLVQSKISKKGGSGQVVVDVPGALSNYNNKQKGGTMSSKFGSLDIEKSEMRGVGQYCKLCEQKLACRHVRKSLIYKPAMLSLVAIAAVCVCAALLFKSAPDVGRDYQPFTWESLKYGAI